MDAAEFTSLVAQRSDGVWVYLRYVVDVVGFGLRRSDEINDLPSGLRKYYADQIRRWRQDPHGTRLLPLLATLGVAGEATPGSVAGPAGRNIDSVAVQHRAI